MKVLFFTSWYPNPDAPQHGDFIQRHAEALAENENVDIGLIFVKANKKSSSEGYVLEDKTLNGLRTIRVYYNPTKNPFLKAIRYRRAYEQGLRYFNQKVGKADIINANVTWPCGIVARKLSKKFNIPYTITEHWSAYYPESEIQLNFLQKHKICQAVRDASKVITVSNYLEESMREMGCEGNYTQIPNVVNMEVFSPSIEEKSDPFTFVHISNFTTNKRAVDILDAFDTLLDMHSNIKLKFIGEGEQINEIKGFLEEEPRLMEKVELLGSLEHNTVAKELRKSHALILFSRYEGLPCVILEAWASGIPVISTNVGGIRDYFRTFLGTLLRGESTDELEKAMKDMIDESSNYDSHQIHDYALKHFSNHAVSERFLEEFKKVISDY